MPRRPNRSGHVRESGTPHKAMYCFYIVTTDGEEIVWPYLKEIQAARMNRTTENHAPSNILKFGWGRMPGYAGGEYLKESQDESID